MKGAGLFLLILVIETNEKGVLYQVLKLVLEMFIAHKKYLIFI